MQPINVQPVKTPQLKDALPQSLDRLINVLAANLDNADAMDFYMRFLDVLDRDADLSKVEHKLKLWILVDPEVGIIKRANDEEKAVIEYTAAFHRRLIRGEEIGKTGLWEVMRKTYESWSQQTRFVPMSAVHWSVVPDPTSLMWVVIAVGSWRIIEYRRTADKLIELLGDERRLRLEAMTEDESLL